LLPVVAKRCLTKRCLSGRCPDSVFAQAGTAAAHGQRAWAACLVRSICHGRRLRFQGSAHHVGARQGISDMGGVVDLKTNWELTFRFREKNSTSGPYCRAGATRGRTVWPGFLPQGRRI